MFLQNFFVTVGFRFHIFVNFIGAHLNIVLRQGGFRRMLRRLHHEQPKFFEFTPANQAWAEAQVTKYPKGRAASAIIPLLWRAQEQEGWLTRPAIEYVADMLGMAYMRAVEVASFYFMFQLKPVGSIAHIQVCGTTSCMICGSENLISICKEKIAINSGKLSDDGKLSWEEVECLGACANAPVVQIGKDYYEDLTAKHFAEIIDKLREGFVPKPGSGLGRFASEPASGLTTLKGMVSSGLTENASVQIATCNADTVCRIVGTETLLHTPWLDGESGHLQIRSLETKEKSEIMEEEGDFSRASSTEGKKPDTLTKPLDKGADDLKKIKGIGPKLENLCNLNGIYHFSQIANWSEAEIKWVDANFGRFKGCASRDNWVLQAKELATQTR